MTYTYLNLRVEADSLPQALVALRLAVVRSGVWIAFPQAGDVRCEA